MNLSLSDLELDGEMDEDGNVQTKYAIPNVVSGTRCWKCFIPGTFFTCKQCNREYHRKCALLRKGYPAPVFKRTLQAAMMEEAPAEMLKCSECVLAEKTLVPSLATIPQSSLNSALIRMARNVKNAFMMKPNKNDEGQTVCLALIGQCIDAVLKKATANDYKSVEEFYADYKQVRYDIVVKFGQQSEQYEVVLSLFRVTGDLINELLTCPTCYIKRITDAPGQEKGNIKSTTILKTVMKETCVKPHFLCWVKIPKFPFWPAKVLGMIMIKDKRVAVVVCFDENKYWNIQIDKEGYGIKTYSTKVPGKTPQGNTSWSNAVRDCDEHIQNAITEFGRVVIPDTAVGFRGDLDKALKEMFPDAGCVLQLKNTEVSSNVI